MNLEMVRLLLRLISRLIQKVSSFSAGLEMVLDGSNEDYVTSEMEKQKRKLKEMSKLLEQQHQLLRLIVQVIEN
jgi:transient receptor potential cation channel subfamily A protein 1